MLKLNRILKHTAWTVLSLIFTGIIAVGILIAYFEMQLPNVAVLSDIPLQIPLRIYTKDGKLIGEYGEKLRNPIKIEQVPPLLIDAILATEDQRYYEHVGVDPFGLIRAAIQLVLTGTKSQGGSTITMQVARNFFLTPKKTFSRKLKEILLAIRIDSEFSKQKVLELYLNKIYLGNHAYGVAAAAQVYYGKPLAQLTLPEMAMLAGLPKAPSALNPLANPIAAKDRRDHVLTRMRDRGYITQAQYVEAMNTPLTASYHGEPIVVKASYVAEMVRDAMEARYGSDVYSKGYKVYTTISSKAQHDANRALRDAVLAYDQRHGYRGPVANWGIPADGKIIHQWEKKLASMHSINELQPAAVIDVGEQSAIAILGNGKSITLSWSGMSWIQKKSTKDILKIGDIIYVLKVKTKTDTPCNTKSNCKDSFWQLVQIPQVEGALVALNPHDGAIIALVGGFSYTESKYNRVIQAYRQPGSSFKPFIYAAAFAKGYTLASVINDAPIVINNPTTNTLWRPENDTRKFYGPTRLRVALAQSRNLVAIRLLRDIGVDYATDFAARFGFDPNKLPHTLSLALGTAVITPLQLTTGYAVFANGGYRVSPYLVSHITDSSGHLIYQAQPEIACANCTTLNTKQDLYPIAPMRQAPEVISPQIAYLITSAMKSVITSGTATRALILKRNDLAGKTGTTNDKVDAWFGGFNGDVVATAWMGFDNPQSLHEYGDQAALPMWIDFMNAYLKNKPENSMPEPPGLVTVKIDPKTGLLARPDQTDAIFEIFRKQYAPTQVAPSGNKIMTNEGTESETWTAPLF